nr:hypothetical protein OH837_00885 [Streptomyces canus]
MRPLTAALLTAAIAATGIVAALAVAARGQDTGDPPPRTPPGAAGRIRPAALVPDAEAGARRPARAHAHRPARGRRAVIAAVGA